MSAETIKVESNYLAGTIDEQLRGDAVDFDHDGVPADLADVGFHQHVHPPGGRAAAAFRGCSGAGAGAGAGACRLGEYFSSCEGKGTGGSRARRKTPHVRQKSLTDVRCQLASCVGYASRQLWRRKDLEEIDEIVMGNSRFVRNLGEIHNPLEILRPHGQGRFASQKAAHLIAAASRSCRPCCIIANTNFCAEAKQRRLL